MGDRAVLRELWLAFRHGHGTYLALLLQMGNFTIIAYALFLERIGVGISMVEFLLIFAAVYIPASIVLGRLHIKHQFQVENKASFEQNPALAKVLYVQAKMIEGTATNGEVREMKEYLRKIADKS